MKISFLVSITFHLTFDYLGNLQFYVLLNFPGLPPPIILSLIIFLYYVLLTILLLSAMPLLLLIYPPSFTATSLSGMIAWFLAGWEREEQDFIFTLYCSNQQICNISNFCIFCVKNFFFLMEFINRFDTTRNLSF